MGKRQHQKDKMYLTCTEWSTLYGGKKRGSEVKHFRRLPFDHCCVSLVPFENPYCDREGNIYELEAIIKYLKKYKVNPVSGKPLNISSLVKLNFSKDAEGNYQCPILRKMLAPNSHFAAVGSTGNVFLYEAVEQLNVKTKNYRDLLTDEPYTKSELIILQDPLSLQKFNLNNFHHIKHSQNLDFEEVESSSSTSQEYNLKSINNETRAALDELKREYIPPPVENKQKKVADKFNAAHYSTGAVAAGFTSTTMPLETKHEPAIIEENTVRYGFVKKKGYVRISTNFGPLNLELHCDLVPKTCENFIKHCLNDYYTGTVFHRSIRHFMIQGGDPTGTGQSGQSIWGQPFENEIKPQLTHAGRGILSMANSGPDTNKSQFFITYRSCKHLDGKHTVFGHVVGGLETLNILEKIEVDNKDRPIQDVTIEKVEVFVDPYKEADDQLISLRHAEAMAPNNKIEKEELQKPLVRELKCFHSGVGKYIDPTLHQIKQEKLKLLDEENIKKKKNMSSEFGDFKTWT